MSWEEVLKANVNVIWGKPKKSELERDKETAKQMDSQVNETCCEEARMKILQLLQHDLDSGEVSDMALFNKIYERVDKATCRQLRMQMEEGAADGDKSAILVLDEWKKCVKG